MSIKEHIISLARKNEFISFGIAFIAAVLLFPVVFDFTVYPISPGTHIWGSLDPSWKLILSKINADHLTWGKDLTITYGPLGYLTTRIGWGMNKYSLLLFDLFVFFNFLFIFYTTCIKSTSRINVVIFIIALIVCLPVFFGSGNALVLLAFLVFWIRQGLGKINYLFYAMQICLILVLFFMKFNTGLVTFVFFYAGLVYNFFFCEKKKLILAVIGILPVLCILVLSKLLNVDLATYIPGGINMVSGYNGIMYMDEGNIYEFKFALLVIFLLLVVFGRKLVSEKEVLFKNSLIIFLVFSSIYVLYKQAFVRNDMEHVLDFYRYILLFFICGYDLYSEQNAGKAVKLLPVMLVVCIFFSKIYGPGPFIFKDRGKKMKYLTGFFNFSETANFLLDKSENLIPQRLHEKIGKQTVDIYPWDVHLLLENKLNYMPRPVPQAYTAYTPYLEERNFEFYNSSRAPHFVFYEYGAIDGRYALFDESKLNLILLNNYNCVDTFKLYDRIILVLEKNNNKLLRFEKIKEFNSDIYEKLIPQKDHYYEIHITNSLKGKCFSFLKHGPNIDLFIKTKNGTERKFKTSNKLLETGIFSDRFFGSTLDFKNQSDSLHDGNKIESYFFGTPDSSFFKREIRITEYKIIY